LLSLGCTNFEKGELVVYHRLYDVCSIQVIAVKNSVGIYDMNSEIHVQTIESK
ncbi:MAG: ABC transporter ATP-binding protein, partial [Ruthenibacterium sp.]